MNSKERMLLAICNRKPDRVPVAPDISNMIPAKFTGRPFWNIYYHGNPPLWKGYLQALDYWRQLYEKTKLGCCVCEIAQRMTNCESQGESRVRVHVVEDSNFTHGLLYEVKAPPPLRGGVAFTLIELLFVIAILSILAALLLPALKMAKEMGRSAICVNNLHQIGVAIVNYSDDNNGFIPSNDAVLNQTPTICSKLVPYIYEGTWSAFYSAYFAKKDYGVFICPSWRQGEGNPPNYESPLNPNRDYASNMLLSGSGSLGGGTYYPTTLEQAVQNIDSNPAFQYFHNPPNTPGWADWLMADGGYRRGVNDINGAMFNGNYLSASYWSWADFKARHHGGANFLFADGSVRYIKQP